MMIRTKYSKYNVTTQPILTPSNGTVWFGPYIY